LLTKDYIPLNLPK